MSTKNFVSNGDMETLMSGIKDAIDGANSGNTKKGRTGNAVPNLKRFIQAPNPGISNGRDIWYDGDNIYYSRNNSHRYYDRNSKTWKTKRWTNGTTVEGRNIWNDGDNIYYSYSVITSIISNAFVTIDRMFFFCVSERTIPLYLKS